MSLATWCDAAGGSGPGASPLWCSPAARRGGGGSIASVRCDSPFPDLTDSDIATGGVRHRTIVVQGGSTPGSSRPQTLNPDGHTLATASADSTARLWETNVDSVVARICRTTLPITRNEWNQYLPGLPYQSPCP